ncbi:40S ribosomal protein S7 [Heracleum sosnowskyi]|uniref:40S ribosomal protein S7 n=1 Tax=Heracleum sosnowskyi TaxID=360622 RepID=A0AAD8IJD2_9APIA|nr:40S ribosomal protein S7 [Heracleum sosnowskyi]
MENTNQDLKSDLKDLFINSAAHIDIENAKLLIHVPYRLRKAFHKIHLNLVRELEKKINVHDAMLEDLVHPAEIAGKRIRYRLDGSKIIKIYLDLKACNETEYKLETVAGVDCGKNVVSEYHITKA